MTTPMRYTAVAVFPDRNTAEQAIEALRQAGFHEDQIGVTAPHAEEDAVIGADRATNTGSTSAGQGAGLGMLIGASLGGLMVGLGSIPALGAVVAGGLLSGLVGGGVVGGLIGLLIGMGVPEEEARYYNEQLEAGHAIVTVNADGRYQEACDILHRHGGHDAHSPLGETGPGRLS